MRNVIRYALAAFVMAASVLAVATQVGAGEIDDLKAQVERSNAQIQRLMKRIEAIEAQKGAAAAPAVSSGGDKVKLAVSGQVNRVSFLADDGTESNFFHSDNENSSTRWRLVGTARINEDFTAGTLIEQDIGQTNNSDSVTIDQATSAGDLSFDNRHLTVWLDSKQFGRVWLGKGNTSSNGIAEIDLSGTSVIEYSGLQDIGGSLRFRTEGAAAPDGPTVSGGSDALGGGVYSQFDGLSRRNRIQYDTPTIMGFKAGLTHVQGDAWDASLRYSANYEQAGLKVAAGVAYWNYGSRTDIADDAIGGSISVLHSSGANLTVSSGTFDRETTTATKTEDPVGFFIKPGWQANLTPLGKTAFSFHYGLTDDHQVDGDEFTSWGFAAVQNIDRAALELFGFYRRYDLDRTGANFEDIDLGGIGARVKF